MIGLMNDAGVSADDVSDAASHVSDSHVCDYTSACSWALAFVCWTVLLLTLVRFLRRVRPTPILLCCPLASPADGVGSSLQS